MSYELSLDELASLLAEHGIDINDFKIINVDETDYVENKDF